MKELDEWKSAREAFLALPAGSPDTKEALERLASAEDALYRSPKATAPVASEHPDDIAVDQFTHMMKAKLKWEREQRSRSGWQNMSAEELTKLLVEHLPKGDPVDVANFCMMLSMTGQQISALLPKATAPVVSEPVEKPYAFEFGKSNGDGTYSIVIERGDPAYVDRFAVKDWPVKPLFTSPQLPEVTEEGVQRVFSAILDCPHSITGEEVVLGYSSDKPLLNATAQLQERIRAALEAFVKVE